MTYPRREELPTELAELLGQMPRHAPIEMLAHSPSLTAPFLRQAQAQFTALELAVRQREVVILTVAGMVGCDYEYTQHIPISEAAGIRPVDRERIRSGDLASLDDEDDRILGSFVAAVVGSPRVGDDVWTSTRRCLTERQIVETLQLVGFYWGLGRLCTVLDLEVETPDGLSSVSAVSALR
jgi:alkylhydroperoxidase family enzyme